jgi:hypothetical protein
MFGGIVLRINATGNMVNYFLGLFKVQYSFNVSNL